MTKTDNEEYWRRNDGVTMWRVMGDEATSDEWWSDEVMECLEMAEMAEKLVEGLGGMEWELDGI